MAHLWKHQNELWEPSALAGATVALAEAGGAAVRLLAMGDGGWVLLVRPLNSVRVNGRPVVAGLRVLRDRDEIVAGGARAFFSTERLARVEAFPGGEGAVFCARCRQQMEMETPAVRCPGCGSWCHQRDDLGCWLYAPACPLCDQATPLDAGYRWQPEF